MNKRSNLEYPVGKISYNKLTSSLRENVSPIEKNEDSVQKDLKRSNTKKIRSKLKDFWWTFKKVVRKKLQKYTIYVLECENEKYYVGSTYNRKQRFQQHLKERGGSKWTRQNKPIRVLQQYKRVPESYYLGMEAQITAECMLQYGVNNVRGAMFSHPRVFTVDDLDALTAFIGHYNNLNYNDVKTDLLRILPRAKNSPVSSRRKKDRRAKKGNRPNKYEINKKSIPGRSNPLKSA